MKIQGFGKQDLISLGKGMLIAGAGAALTYLYAYVTNPAIISHMGVWGAVVMTLAPVLVNMARKALDGKVE